MILTDIRRIIRSGALNFYRNGVVSLASILVLWITLLVLLTILFSQAVLGNALEAVKDKVDITVYFSPGADETKVSDLKGAVEALPQVSKVSYVSADVALAQFKERRAGDELTLQALEEIGENPLGASLDIKAQDPTQYQIIADFLQGDSEIVRASSDIIFNINYNKNKIVIDRLNQIIAGARTLGVAITILLMAISVIITFNTILLTIFISKEEISIMRLVGAGKRYVVGPFIVEGIIYGLLAGLLATAAFYPISVWLSRRLSDFLGLDLLRYYIDHFAVLLLLSVVVGIILGSLSSALAVRRYLNR